MKTLRFITLLLMVIGAINWGLVGLFRFDVVEALFGIGAFARLIYIVIGLAGIYGISLFCIPDLYSRKCSCFDKFCKK
jgi:uncharacterized protein